VREAELSHDPLDSEGPREKDDPDASPMDAEAVVVNARLAERQGKHAADRRSDGPWCDGETKVSL